TARLVAAGVPMNHAALEERLVDRSSAVVTRTAAPRRSLMMRFSAHPDPVTFPVADPATPKGPTAEQRRDDVAAPQIMPPAPRVPFGGDAPMAWPPTGPTERQRPGEHRAVLSGREAPANGTSGLAQTMMNTHQGRLAELHMAFLRQQA